MSEVLSVGDKLHVIHRQLFESHTRRHSVGTWTPATVRCPE